MTARLCVFLIKIYQWVNQKYLIPRYSKNPTWGCRYKPSCSVYTQQAIAKYGALKGIRLGKERIGRCNVRGGWGEDPLL